MCYIFCGVYYYYIEIELKKEDSRYSEECSICLNNLGSEKCYEIKNCKHIFHKKCIKIWKGYSDSCPMCRTSIVIPSS